MNPLIEFIEKYGPLAGERGPVLFVEQVLGVESVDPWQQRVLEDFGRGERRISIRSCHGPGKTAVLAWCVIYMLLFRFPQKTVATAPTKGQLFDGLYSEVGKWFTRLPDALKELYIVKSDRIELKAAPDESFFSVRTARREAPEALQGVHSDHVLLIADEASGVDETVFEAAAGSMSGHNATTVLASNPVRTSGFFFDTHHGMRDIWKTYHISYKDSPRVIPDFRMQVARQYGEDSNAYRVRVLGEFPRSDDDTVIPFEIVEAAVERDIQEPPDAPVIWSLDVARFGDDTSVLTERTARVLHWQKEYKALDLMELTGRVKALWDERQPSYRPREILVDVIGLGAGVVDRLRELKLPARGINVSETASSKERYRNLRSELWFAAREWLERRDVMLPAEVDKLCSELVVPRYTFTSSGKVMVEPKADMKKRGHRSPNFADSFILSFASTAATLVHGKGRDWNQPLRRNLKCIV